MVKGKEIAMLAGLGIAAYLGWRLFSGSREMEAQPTASQVLGNAGGRTVQEVQSAIDRSNLEAWAADWQQALNIKHQFPSQSTEEIATIIHTNRITQTDSLYERWLEAGGRIAKTLQGA